jgi:hypothetical protein
MCLMKFCLYSNVNIFCMALTVYKILGVKLEWTLKILNSYFKSDLLGFFCWIIYVISWNFIKYDLLTEYDLNQDFLCL